MCFLLADRLVAMLKEQKGRFQWLPEALPQRWNHCRQPGVDCGFYVAWWLEDEIRAANGEGFFS